MEHYLRNCWYMAGWAEEIGEAGLVREIETLRDFFASATLTALVEGHYLIASTDACLCRSPVRWLMGLNGTVVDADAGQLARAFLGRQILPVSRAQSRS